MPTYALRVALTFGVGAKKGVNTWHIRTGTPIAPGTHPMVTAIKNFYTSAFTEVPPSDRKADYVAALTEVGVAAPSLVGGVPSWNATGPQPAATYGPAGV